MAILASGAFPRSDIIHPLVDVMVRARRRAVSKLGVLTSWVWHLFCEGVVKIPGVSIW